jgi:hypothetical protein
VRLSSRKKEIKKAFFSEDSTPDPFTYQNSVGTATRICQELPNCNWLEEKILRAAEAGYLLLDKIRFNEA